MKGSKTTVDWLRFRTQATVREGFEALRPLFGKRSEVFNLEPLDRAKDGFQLACALRLGEWVIGRVDFGGESQRGWVRWNITGVGCELVEDWDAVDELERLAGCEIRRMDIALTTWHDEVHHDMVVEAHDAGRFQCGGRPPALQQITSSDPMAGRTCYVGKRDSDKFFRGYEKGLELLAKMGRNHVKRNIDGSVSSVMRCDASVLIDGCPADEIYRCEVELKSESRVIPWEVVERRDQYFAGSYPFLADLLPGVESDAFMRRPERAPQAALMAVLANARIQYGASLYTALHAYHGDIGRVWEQIVGTQHNAAMLAAGVLEVEHD